MPAREIDLDELNEVLKRAEHRLNKAYDDYHSGATGLRQDFLELVLQVSIFHYDMCVEWSGFLRNKPAGFSSAVALKGVILRLYEYSQWYDQHGKKKLEQLAASREVSVGPQLHELRKRWRDEISVIKGWADIRNDAAGHYGKDFEAQLAALKSIRLDNVHSAFDAFTRFNLDVFRMLRDVGRGPDAVEDFPVDSIP